MGVGAVVEWGEFVEEGTVGGVLFVEEGTVGGFWRDFICGGRNSWRGFICGGRERVLFGWWQWRGVK